MSAGMSKHYEPAVERERFFGSQRIYHFANGYRASVISIHCRDGFELAVMTGRGVVYDTPITDDVIDGLSEDGVQELLLRIDALPVREVGR